MVVVDALQKVNETALNFIGQKNWRLDEVSRPGLRQAVLNHILAFQTVQQSWAIFLPEKMNKDMLAFMKVFSRCVGSSRIRGSVSC